MRRTLLFGLAASLTAAGLPMPSMAQVAPSKATLPAVRTGCLSIEIPYIPPSANAGEAAVAADDAAAVFEQTRVHWQALATTAKVEHRGAVYVVMDLPPKDFSGTQTPGSVCAVIDGGAPVADLTIATSPTRDGFVGYCKETDPEECLAGVFSALGFTDSNPWPRLPIYSLWRDGVPEPHDASEIIDYLTLAAFEVRVPEEDEGATRSFEIDNLAICPQSGCEDSAQTIDTSAGRGIAWFLPLSDAEKPHPESDTNNSNEGGAR